MTVKSHIKRNFSHKPRVRQFHCQTPEWAEIQFMQASGVFLALYPTKKPEDHITLAGDILTIPIWFPFIPQL